MKQKDYTKNKKYQNWLKGTERSLTEKKLKAIETLVNKEVDLLLNLSVKDRFLYLKRDEIKRWHPTQATKDILWVERNIFKSQGKSDFRRISPELVEVSDDFFMETKNIWGESFSISTKNKDAHKIHWDILRTLVSSAPNDGTVGRAIRFLVIDKSTRKYLGVICISSAMYRTKPIHQEIGWDAELIKKRKVESGLPGLHNLANGQTIVPTQPFGSNFLGGKLLSLLCLSKPVTDAWERKYGNKLVGVHTTSLFGSSDGTQYSNLSPYWRELAQTTGQESIKLTQSTYEQVKVWIKHKFPEKYYQLFEEKNEITGMLETRESKSQALTFAYKKMGISKFTSGEQRGVYSSFLYSNAIDFLNEKISDRLLEPSFDNSVEALTNFWRFGSMGDTTVPSAELKAKEKNPDRMKKKIAMKGLVKGNLSLKTGKKLQVTGPRVDWYLPLIDLTWDEIQSRYSSEPLPNKT